MPGEQAGRAGEQAPPLSAGLAAWQRPLRSMPGLPGPAQHVWLQPPGQRRPATAGREEWAPTSSRFTWVLSNSRRVSSSRIFASCLLTRDLSTMDCSRNSTWLWRACSWGWEAGGEEGTEPTREGAESGAGKITMVTRRQRGGGREGGRDGRGGGRMGL